MNNSLSIYKETQDTPNYYEKYLTDINLVSGRNAKNILIVNDIWEREQLLIIEETRRIRGIDNVTISFNAYNPGLNLELKYFIFRKLRELTWNIDTLINHMGTMKHFCSYMNIYYPDTCSLVEINEDALREEWYQYLESCEINILMDVHFGGEVYRRLSPAAKLPINILNALQGWPNSGSEWEKDTWDIRNLKEYGISHTMSNSHYKVNFIRINNKAMRELAKKYFKRRLISGNGFTWGTTGGYVSSLTKFLNFISDKYPDWKNICNLSRADIEEYIELLVIWPSNSRDTFMSFNMRTLSSFIYYIQAMDWDEAPIVPHTRLIHKEDFPRGMGTYRHVDKYVPDYVMNQLIKNIKYMRKDIALVVLIMYQTGLRISDVLNLKYESIKKVDDQYWIVTDIFKIKKKDHSLPVTDELGEMIVQRADFLRYELLYTENPSHFLFPSRIGGYMKSMTQGFVQRYLNSFGKDFDIRTEDGELYYFKNHAFRHAFAVNCLNNGMDIITLQDFMAHSSREMTLAYAKLLDTTKRTEFEKVVKSGVFSFKSSTELKEETNLQISKERLSEIWMVYKLNAIDTPYGICMQRSEGKCKFAMQPPCLTCRGGEPCKDLCIGVSDSDLDKYRLLMASAKSMIKLGEKNNKEDIKKENQALYDRYSMIYEALVSGKIIYGRAGRLSNMAITGGITNA